VGQSITYSVEILLGRWLILELLWRLSWEQASSSRILAVKFFVPWSLDGTPSLRNCIHFENVRWIRSGSKLDWANKFVKR